MLVAYAFYPGASRSIRTSHAVLPYSLLTMITQPSRSPFRFLPRLVFRPTDRSFRDGPVRPADEPPDSALCRAKSLVISRIIIKLVTYQ